MRGLNVVEGSLPRTGLPGEHVHDPRAVMRELFRLVRPGGKVYLTTLNRRSYGANLFGPSWRGLEPPRHLVLFTPDALVKLVTDGGGLSSLRFAWSPRSPISIFGKATR
jgi:SAM-dependent methyltransferase